jgi:hypothetical protein
VKYPRVLSLKGRLHGNGLEAECVISRDVVAQEGNGLAAQWDRSISKVVPDLPDGVYTLNVSGQDTAVRCQDGLWSLAA